MLGELRDVNVWVRVGRGTGTPIPHASSYASAECSNYAKLNEASTINWLQLPFRLDNALRLTPRC